MRGTGVSMRAVGSFCLVTFILGPLAASSAHAALIRYDLRAVQDGTTGATVHAAKYVQVGALQGVVSMQLWAMVENPNGINEDEGFKQGHFSVLSSGGPANLRGDLVALNVAPFDSLFSQPGLQIDLDGDGDMDVGDNRHAGIQPVGFFIPDSGYLVTAPGPNGPLSRWSNYPGDTKRAETAGGKEYSSFLIGSILFAFEDIDTGAALSTTVNVRPRIKTDGAAASRRMHGFGQDGLRIFLPGDDPGVITGEAVNIMSSAANAVPEPSTWLLAVVAACGFFAWFLRKKCARPAVGANFTKSGVTSSRALLLRCAVGILATLLFAASVSAASIRFDLRAVQDGTNGATVHDPKYVQVGAPSGVVNMQLWAMVENTNGINDDDAFWLTHLSFLSTGGNLRGDLTATNTPFFAPFWGPEPGVQSDVDGDGDLDVGDNRRDGTSGSAVGSFPFFLAFSNYRFWPQVPNDLRLAETIGGQSFSSFRIGSLDFAFNAVDLLSESTTAINVQPRMYTEGEGGPNNPIRLVHQFREDGQRFALLGTDPRVLTGAPVNISTIPTHMPEPASWVLGAIGAASVLAWRRYRNRA